MQAQSQVDRVNRASWRLPATVAELAARSGHSDPGEEAVLRRAAAVARDGPILDLGVGAGRTVPLLRAISRDYVALDYLPELVESAGRRFPDARIELGDARDLSRFRDGSFHFAYFSLNGIDGLAHDDRAAVLRELRRVVGPGGLAAWSTHNLDHRAAGRPPWDPGWYGRDLGRLARRASPAAALRLARKTRAYRRLRRFEERGADWALLVHPAYGFSGLNHFATHAAIRAEALAAGFSDVTTYGTDGNELRPDDRGERSAWLHVVAG